MIFPFASIGEVPQDLKFKGEDVRLQIGARNRIREYVTMNPAPPAAAASPPWATTGLFMASSHVGHDCRIGDRVILANSVAIAGHCVLEDDVIVGGLSGVHQWVRIGRGAMIGAVTMVTADVIPYGLVQGRAGIWTAEPDRVEASRRDPVRHRGAAVPAGRPGPRILRDTARTRAEAQVTAWSATCWTSSLARPTAAFWRPNPNEPDRHHRGAGRPSPGRCRLPGRSVGLRLARLCPGRPDRHDVPAGTPGAVSG